MEYFQRLGGNIRALAAVHDILTDQARRDADANHLSARATLTKLIGLIQQAAGDRRIETYLDDAWLSARQASSLAIVVNEFLTNALKHGKGEAGIRFLVEENLATLEILDNGPGFGDRFDPRLAANTGLELVEHISRYDLHATICYSNRPAGGGCVSVVIPLSANNMPLQ